MTRFARRKYSLTPLENEMLLFLDDGECDLVPLIGTLHERGRVPLSADGGASLGPIGLALRRLLSLGLVEVADCSGRGYPRVAPARALELTRLETWMCWDPGGYWRGSEKFFDTLKLVRPHPPLPAPVQSLTPARARRL